MMCREVTTHAEKKKASRHDGRKQNSYCLNRPLDVVSIRICIVNTINFQHNFQKLDGLS